MIWSDWEIAKLKEAYSLGGFELAKQELSHRTDKAIMTKASKLGVVDKKLAWTAAEEDLIRHNLEMPLTKLSVMFPNRTVGAISSKVRRLKIQLGLYRWSNTEDKILKQAYKKTSLEDLCKLLPHRTPIAIENRIYTLKLSAHYNEWTTKEERILRDRYGKETIAEIHKLIPNHTPASIKQRAQTLGIQKKLEKWTPEDEQILSKAYMQGGLPLVREKIVGRSDRALLAKIHHMGLRRRGTVVEPVDNGRR